MVERALACRLSAEASSVFGESQRDSIAQPGVGPQSGTTPGHQPPQFLNPVGVESPQKSLLSKGAVPILEKTVCTRIWARGGGTVTTRGKRRSNSTPSGLISYTSLAPGVARASQPRAECSNPVGVDPGAHNTVHSEYEPRRRGKHTHQQAGLLHEIFGGKPRPIAPTPLGLIPARTIWSTQNTNRGAVANTHTNRQDYCMKSLEENPGQFNSLGRGSCRAGCVGDDSASVTNPGPQISSDFRDTTQVLECKKNNFFLPEAVPSRTKPYQGGRKRTFPPKVRPV